MTDAELRKHKQTYTPGSRVPRQGGSSAGPVPQMQPSSPNARSDAVLDKTRNASDRTDLSNLALLALLNAAIYYLMFTMPYGLQRLWLRHQLDLDRLASSEPAARWYILGGMAVEWLLYYLAWRTIRHINHRKLAWVIVIVGALASGSVLLYFYPLGSTDIWDYIMHGRMLGIYHANPFVKVAAQYPQDIFAWYAGWPYDTSAYGPFWELLAGVTARAAGNGVVQNVIAFKILVGLFLAASVGLVALILRRKDPSRMLPGALLLAWNPLVLYETLGNGHNDIFMVFWILVAALLLLDRHYTLAILALLAGALVKFIPLLMVPAAGMIALSDLPSQRSRVQFVVVTAVASVVVVVAAYQPFWAGPQILSVERRQEMYTGSIPAAIVALRFPEMGWLEATRQISKIAALLTGFYAVVESFRAWNDRSWTNFVRSAFNVSMFYLLFACLWFWPWYAIWPLALVPVLSPGYAASLGQVFGVAAMSKALVFGPLYAWHQSPSHDWIWQQERLGPTVMAMPLIYAAYGLMATSIQKLQQRVRAAGTEPGAA